jgi:hypothetical protein
MYWQHILNCKQQINLQCVMRVLTCGLMLDPKQLSEEKWKSMRKALVFTVVAMARLLMFPVINGFSYTYRRHGHSLTFKIL